MQSVAPQARRRKGAARSKTVFLPLALPFAVLAGVAVFGALTPYHRDAGPPPGQAGALVWGDGIFANRVELRAWFRLHGGSYRAWARQHPAALRLVKPRAHAPLVKTRAHAPVTKPPVHRTVKPHTVKPHPVKPHTVKPNTVKPHPTVRRTAQPAQPAQPRTMAKAGGSSHTTLLFVILGLLALGAGSMPRRLLMRLGLPTRAIETRLGVASAGVAILVSVAFTLLIA